MRQVATFPGRGSVHSAQSGVAEFRQEEPAPAPVFVDQSGLRSRLLRRFGWPVSVVGAILAAAMGSSLVGMQSEAPAMEIPPKPVYLPARGPLSPTSH